MIKLRPYQQACKDAFYAYYEQKDGHGLIVVPTAGGKSLVIGSLVSEIIQRWPNQRILILSHVKELIVQNHQKIMMCWPSAPAGIYNAALGKRQAHFPIVVGTVQSVWKKAAILGHRDILFVDECDLIQPESMGMYGFLIDELLKINPLMKICGLTATDYRLDSGLLTEGDNALFDDVMIEISMKHLLEEGYLTPPISKSSIVQADLQGVKITAGEYNNKQMAARFDQKAFIDAALDSDMQYMKDRRSIALFCATIENAYHVAHNMTARGIYTEVVTGEMPAAERDDKLARFRSGSLRSLASVGVITTGTDIPNIDCINLFRATKSARLYQQIVGRGFRVLYADGYDIETREGRLAAIRNGIKPDFLVLDHGGNIERHGAITNVQKPRRRDKEKRPKAEPKKVRICEMCRTAWPLEAMVCGICETPLVAERDPTSNLNIDSSNADIMGTAFTRGEAAQWFDVDDIRYARHEKPGAPDSLKVVYFCGIWQFPEWVHLERKDRRRAIAVAWWQKRGIGEPPDTVEKTLYFCPALKVPARILVRKDGNFTEILNYEFHPEGQEQLAG